MNRKKNIDFTCVCSMIDNKEIVEKKKKYLVEVKIVYI